MKLYAVRGNSKPEGVDTAATQPEAMVENTYIILYSYFFYLNILFSKPWLIGRKTLRE